MAEVEISYKGSNIATMSASGTKTLLTEAKYMEDDVTITYARPSAPSGTKQISITSNGTTTEDVTAYASAQITANVPNTYAAADEGKVVSNGALVAQTSDTVTANDTYDTTLINSLTVNVSGGGTDTLDELFANTLTQVISSTPTSLKAYFFQNQTALTKVSCSNVTTIGSRCFDGCTGLTEVSLPSYSGSVPDYAFCNCSNLTTLSLPSAARSPGSYTFQNCTKLTSTGFSAYNIVSSGQDSWNGCQSIEYFVHDINGIYTRTLQNCKSLLAVDVGTSFNATRASMCNGCSKLKTFVIRRSDAVVALAATNAFSGTPFASGGIGGTLYVPAALVSGYQTASNWSTIIGYANNQIKSIESTHTDPDAPIDLTLYYADGTLIPTT